MPGDRRAGGFPGAAGRLRQSRAPRDIVYYLFDLPYCAGYDLRDVPLVERRSVLQRIVRAQAARQGALQRGVRCASRRTSRLGLPAGPGRRDRQAPRLAPTCRGARPTGSSSSAASARSSSSAATPTRRVRAPGIGSLLLGVHDKDGTPALRRQRRHGLQRADACASCAPGWSDLARRCQPLRPGRRASAQRPLGQARADRRGGFRRVDARRPHPALGLPRPAHRQAGQGDHPRAEARATVTSRVPSKPAAARREQPTAARLAARAAIPIASSTPQSGTTKIALVRYYALVAPLMMEHLKGRPVSLVRAPHGHGRRTVLPEARRALQDARRRAARSGDRPGPPAAARGRVAGRPAVGRADERRSSSTPGTA